MLVIKKDDPVVYKRPVTEADKKQFTVERVSEGGFWAVIKNEIESRIEKTTNLIYKK